MSRLVRWLFFGLIVRLLVLVVLGLNVRRRERLPGRGPAILVANHNSHLDTLALMTLFPQSLLPSLRPVAAADYFLSNRILAWFALEVVGIVPIRRKPAFGEDPLRGCAEALDTGAILILYPEGSRGEPERLARFKSGIAHLAERFPSVPTIPIFMRGLGKALPKGEALLVPFFCDVFVGAPLFWSSDRAAYMNALEESFRSLADEAGPSGW